MVISLHGHVFTTWKGNEKACRLFVSILKKANFVTVLGEVQKEKLVNLGIPKEKVLIIPNSCELTPAQKINEVKHINILYLSNLIEDKGYKEFLESILLLYKTELEKEINITLCGKVYEGDLISKEKYIEDIMKKITLSANIRINWLKGAYGADKEKLFQNADIFIFPSKYKVEAQPIVLIEAMASGCGIITTGVGEIPSTVSQENAIILTKPEPELISKNLLELITDSAKLKKMQLASKTRFENLFSLEVYKLNWRKIFSSL